MFKLLRLAAFFSVLFTLALSMPVRRAPKCNGYADLCGRKYGNTTFLGSHDSFAVSQSIFALARNQEVDLEHQLALGVRMLQAQAHMDNNQLHFCHTSCALFNGGTVEAYLSTVKTFLDRNPNEVLTLIIANPERISISKVYAPIFQKVGLDKMAYIPPQPVMTRDDWPTLGEMIETGKRVVVFVDRAAEGEALEEWEIKEKGGEKNLSAEDKQKVATSTPEKREVEYILPQFRMMWEDEYDPDDSRFTCKVDRTEGPLAPSQQLSLINHNLNVNLIPIGRGLRIPDRMNAPRTNGEVSIMEHAAHCAPYVNDQRPNFVLLDWVNVGQGIKAVAKLNGL